MKLNPILNDLKSAPLHTAIGATEQSAVVPQAFNQRQSTDNERKFIRSYRESMLGSRYGSRGALKVTSRTQNTGSQESAVKPTEPKENRQGFNSEGGHHFSEPTTRSYNPYG